MGTQHEQNKKVLDEYAGRHKKRIGSNQGHFGSLNAKANRDGHFYAINGFQLIGVILFFNFITGVILWNIFFGG